MRNVKIYEDVFIRKGRKLRFGNSINANRLYC